MRKEFVGMKETKSNFLSLSLPIETTIGKIHSVFKTTFNVQLKDQLVHFGSEGMPVSAHGCIISKEEMDAILENGVPGDMVRYKDGRMTFYTRHQIVSVPFSSFKEIDLRIPFEPVSKKGLESRLLYQKLNAFPFWENIGLPVDETVRKNVSALESLSETNEEELEEILAYFVGRGGGLTPSGDDFIVGFTMARKAFEKTDDWDAAVKAALKIRSTTDISKAYYKAAFAGYVSELFCVLVRGLAWENEQEINDLIELVRRYGHTSGTDTLFGFTTGLRSLINEKREN